MKNYLLKGLTMLLMLCLSNGCSLITIQSPWADVTKLGTVIKPGGHITLPSKIGLVTIEYVSPTKRRLICKGESREFSLMKSKQLNGIYGGPMRLKPDAIDNIYGISYQESTRIFSSDEEYQEHLRIHVDGYGFEHRTNTQMIVNCSVGEERKKYLYIGIEKYQFAGEKVNP